MRAAAFLPMITLGREGNDALVESRLLRIVRHGEEECSSSNGRVCPNKTDKRGRRKGDGAKSQGKDTQDTFLVLKTIC